MYWRASEDPEEQVDWFIEIVKKKIDLPPAIDVERYNNVGVLSPADAEQSIFECAQLLTSFYNVEPLLYTSWWSWRSLCNDGELARDLPLWVAAWTTAQAPLKPVPAVEWEFWQFTSAYPLPGQPKTCDANRYNGSEAEFAEYVKVNRSLMYPEAPPPEPEPDPQVFLPLTMTLGGTTYDGEVVIVE